MHFTPARVQNMPDCLRCARDACAYWAGAPGIPGVAAPISFRQVQTNQIQTGIRARPDQKNRHFLRDQRLRYAIQAPEGARCRECKPVAGATMVDGRKAVRAPRWRAGFDQNQSTERGLSQAPTRQSQGTATGEQEGSAVHASIIVRRNYGKVDGGPGGAKRNCHDWSRQTQRCTSNQLVRTRGI